MSETPSDPRREPGQPDGTPRRAGGPNRDGLVPRASSRTPRALRHEAWTDGDGIVWLPYHVLFPVGSTMDRRYWGGS